MLFPALRTPVALTFVYLAATVLALAVKATGLFVILLSLPFVAFLALFGYAIVDKRRRD